jgi:hypothetical protein
MMHNTMIAYAAYGRHPELQDWKDGKDFSIHPYYGPYFSIRDSEALKAEGVTHIMFVRRREAGPPAFTIEL